MITALQTFEHFLVIPQRINGARQLAPMRLHPAQREFLAAYDAVDADGAPLYDELAIFWLKKTGKSETCGGLVVAELIGNDREPDREIIIVAGDKDQAQSLTFASACRFVRRNPWLAERCRVLKSEIVYREKVHDERTGGEHVEEHIVRAVPADPDTNHGGRQNLTVFDEFWIHDNVRGYDLIEALARAPTRQHPRIVYATYAGLKSQAVDGFPLWDLWQRWKAWNEERLYVSYLGGEDGWRTVPWITERFIEQQRRQFAHVPSKFKRLWLNEWASGDAGSFLSADEIRDATDSTLTEPDGPVPGCAIGVDLGLTFDTTGIVAAHVDGHQRLIVDAVRILRGTKKNPVRLMEVEDTIMELARRLGTGQVTADRWQSQLLAERLRARGLTVTLVNSDVSSLDKWATALKRWFAQRLIKIPNHPELIEQLESLEAEELRRRDRVRFTATGAGHDDAAIALVLAGQPHAAHIGHLRMAEQDGCNYERATGNRLDCYLWRGMGLPIERYCRTCPGHVSTQAALAAYTERTGELLDLRTFVHGGLIEMNVFALRIRANAVAQNLR